MTPTARRLLAIASGGVLALAAPPLSMWPAVFVSMVLFAMATDGVRARTALMLGWFSGCAATLGAYYWITGTVTRFTPLTWAGAFAAYVLLAVATGVSLGVTACLARIVAPVVGHAVGLALALLIAERFVPGIFPWQYASPLIEAPWLRQSADVLGVSGLGAVLLGCSAVAARAFTARGSAEAPRRAVATAALCVFVVLWGYGAVRARQVLHAMAAAPTARVALIQPSIPAMARWDERQRDPLLWALQRRTHDAARDRHLDLIVWSEATFPYPLPHRPAYEGGFAPPVYPSQLDVPLLFGALTEDRDGARYNAAVLRNTDGTFAQPVAKRMLVPFGEYVPVIGRFAWVRRTFERASGLTPGRVTTQLTTQRGLRLGVLNCFEDTVDWIGADLAASDVLINITNDAWFGDGAAPWQHLMLARWRAIETGRALLRAVDTGVTCDVDPLGRVRQHLPVGPAGTLVVDAPRMALHTVASRVIPFAPTVATGLWAVAVIARIARARRRSS